MTELSERDLFSAYRTLDGYSAPCACGDAIEAPDSAEETIADAVLLHNESPLHQRWSIWQDAVHALQRPARKPCPCHNHAAS